MVVPADWKEVRLGDLGSTFGGLTGKSSKDFGEGNSNFVTFMNVMSNVVLNSQGTEKVRIGNGERQSQLLEGDVIFNGSSETPEEVGFGSTVPLELSGLYLNSFCFGFRRKDTKSLDPKFFAYLTRSPLGRDIIRPMAQGSTRYNIAKTNLLNGRFPLPPLKEQEAIAEALSDADAAIESIDALIAKNRDVKQATMQQLLTGRTRLPGFTADWKEVRLGECLTIMHGKNQSQVVDPEGSYPILATGGVIGRTNSYLSNKPSVLIGRKGTIDRPQYMDTPFWTVDTLFYSEVKNGNSAKFLFYKFLMVDWKKYNEASGVPSLNASTIENVEMMVPPLKAQEAIAEALTVMDNELEALTEQVSKLRMVKEGMMQDLLTGKVRLV